MPRWFRIPCAACALAALLVLVLAPRAHADDRWRAGDWTPAPGAKRLYLRAGWGRQSPKDEDIGAGLSLPGGLGHDLLVGGLGVDFGRYLGLELAAEYFESPLRLAGLGQFAEYSVWAYLLQARVRYPLLRGRFVPYAVFGAGRATGEVNDGNALGLDPRAPRFNDRYQTTWVYAVGLGFEHFLAPNVSAGLEAKLLVHEPTLDTVGGPTPIDSTSIHVSANLRCYWPGPAFAPCARPARHGPVTPYFALRIGNLWSTTSQFTPTLDWDASKGKDGLGGTSVGADVNDWLSVEVTVDQYERGVGAIDPPTGLRVGLLEVSTWNLVPQVRLRRPVLGGRLVPYVVLGAGAGLSQGNDAARSPPPGVPTLHIDDVSFVATAGLGVEYFIARNMALGLESRWTYNRYDAVIDGVTQRINADRLLLGGHLRVYLR